MLIPVEGNPTIKMAKELKEGDALFLPFWRPHQASNYVAYWNKRGLNLKTRMASIRGIWGTAIQHKERK